MRQSDRFWEKKQFIDSAFGASLVASCERNETKRENGTRHRWIDATFRATDGSQTVSICEDLEAAEQVLAFIAAYVRELKAAKKWEDAE